MLDNVIPAVLTNRHVGQHTFHPLHVVVSTDVFLKCCEDNFFYAYTDEKEFCGVIFIDEILSRNIFVVVHSKSVKSQSGDSNSLHLYVTSEFLQHYHFIPGSVVFFKPIKCFPLSKVVLCATSSVSYNWTKSDNWQLNLLVSTCQNKVLCRRNDILLASAKAFDLNSFSLLFDLITAVCEPVEQGVLTVNTTLIVVNVSDKCTYAQLKNESEHFGVRACACHMSSFAQLLEDLGEPYVKDEGKFCLKLQVIRRHSHVIQKIFMKMDTVIDPLTVVLVSESVLKKMHLRPGQLVTITACSLFSIGLKTKHALQKKARLAAFCSVGMDCGIGSYAYVSPCLWFNLTSQPTSLKESTDMQLEVSFGENVSPPFATEAYVSLVQSPYYDGTVDTDSILENHFRKKRYVMKGDVFGVDMKDFNQKGFDSNNLRLPVVYFRVSMIEGPPSHVGYFIDTEHSRLYQAGTIQSYIPVYMENTAFFSAPSYFDSPAPSGIDAYVKQLSSLVLPILKIWNRGNFQEFHISTNILLTGESGCGKTVVVKALCKCLSLHLYLVNCHELTGESSAVTEARLRAVIQKASVYAPCIMLLKNIEFIGKEKELKGENSRVLNSLSEQLKNVNPWGNEWPVVVIATANNVDLLSGDLASSFLHHIHMDPPLEHERKAMLQHLLCPYSMHPNASVDYISQRTAGFILGDLTSLVSEAVKFRYARLKETISMQEQHFLEEDILVSGIHITRQDLISALEKEQSFKAEKSGAPEIPNVQWSDVGGLSYAKEEILDTIQLPLNHPELLSTGLRRSGVLLYGPPGTGKTLLAKAVATECSLNFLSVKGPELINMYVGQSEENVRAIFNQARAALPCIIFFDELDSLAPNRGKSGDSGGVTDRVVSQLLAELDGFDNSAEVFVIGATNRLDLIDPALLRPGRFDRHVYVGIPSDKESKLSILKAITRKLQVSEDVKLEDIIEACPKNLSGADFYSLCSNAMMHSIKKSVSLIEKGITKTEDVQCSIETEDFMTAIKELVPSVSEDELKWYQSPN